MCGELNVRPYAVELAQNSPLFQATVKSHIGKRHIIRGVPFSRKETPVKRPRVVLELMSTATELRGHGGCCPETENGLFPRVLGGRKAEAGAPCCSRNTNNRTCSALNVGPSTLCCASPCVGTQQGSCGLTRHPGKVDSLEALSTCPCDRLQHLVSAAPTEKSKALLPAVECSLRGPWESTLQ